MSKLFSIFFILIFLASSGFGFLYAFDMSHHSHTNPCPFMQNHTAVCDMNFFRHFSLWKSNFSYVFFNSILVLFIFIYYFKPFLNFSRFRFFRFRKNLYFRSLYQLLFSEGILNPKAP